MTMTRTSEVERLARHIENSGFPRLQMLVLISIAGGAGFLASFTLLHLGVESMAVRYPLAITAAYGVFFGLLWLWLRTTTSDYADLAANSPDLSIPTGGSGGQVPVAGDADAFSTSSAFGGESFTSTGGSSSKSFAIGDLDIGIVPIIALVIVGSILFSMLWVVWVAPALFAELLVDAALAAGLYRRLRRAGDTGDWVSTAFGKTFVPYLISAVVAMGGALAIHAYVPEAVTLGEAVRISKEKWAAEKAEATQAAAERSAR